MIAAKHTPGPWLIQRMRDQQEVWISTKSPDATLGYTSWDGFAVVYGCDENKTTGEAVMLANARLIAAAPELLEAARAAQTVLALLDKEVKALGLKAGNVPEMLRAAIAKVADRPAPREVVGHSFEAIDAHLSRQMEESNG